MFCSAECPLLRAERFSRSLGVLYRGLRIIFFFDQKYTNFFPAVNLISFWSSDPELKQERYLRGKVVGETHRQLILEEFYNISYWNT